MRRTPFCLIVALLTCLGGLGVSHASAQDADGANTQLPQSPLELLLDQREALDLTEAQRAQLDRIRGRLASRNDPLIQQMLTLREQWQQERRAGRGDGRPRVQQRLQRIRSHAEQIRERIGRNNRAAMQSVNRLLTPPQRAQLRALIQERRRQAPPDDGGNVDGGDGD
jgi:Spy/CpxP family protein refolding chaperone